MRWALWLLAGAAGSALAGDPLPNAEAAAWLQRMADASRQLNYEGVFIFKHGDSMQTLRVVNRPSGALKESTLTAMDGTPREVHCTRGESVNVTPDGKSVHLEKRLSSRYFPDLLPANPAALTNWYAVSLGAAERVAGLDCRQVELIPKDAYRWGHILCVDKDSFLPLKAMMVNQAKQALLQYTFAEVHIGKAGRPARPARAAPAAPEEAPPGAAEALLVRQLPPGYTRVAAMKRKLPNVSNEVEHWVYSDGLTHISLFIEPTSGPVETVKGASPKGMVHLLTRQVGPWQVTVLGDAPWAAVETIAMSLAERGK